MDGTRGVAGELSEAERIRSLHPQADLTPTRKASSQNSSLPLNSNPNLRHSRRGMQLLRHPPFLRSLFPRAELNAEREPAVQQGF